MTVLMRVGATLTALVCILGSAVPALAQDAEMSDEQAAYFEHVQTLVDGLEPRTGDIVLGDDLVTLHVPDDFYFLDSTGAETVLVDIWGNPPGQGVMGMLFPAEYSPIDPESWAVTLEYMDEGHISDEDAAEIDYEDLLESMQDDTLATNDDRVAAGYPRVDLLGWAEPPHYDPASRKLYWAKELKFGDDDEETTLNYDIRALGRTGVLSMTFIASGSQLGEINRRRESVLAMAEFNPGNRYEDFDSSIDKVAAYGIGALVAGKVAAKAGIFSALLLMLKKFGVLLLVGLGALGKKLGGLFGRKGEQAIDA